MDGPNAVRVDRRQSSFPKALASHRVGLLCCRGVVVQSVVVQSVVVQRCCGESARDTRLVLKTPGLDGRPPPGDVVGLLEGMATTRAIRRYQDQPVPEEALRAIL